MPYTPGNKFYALSAAMPNGEVNFASDTIKVLLTNTAPIATNTQYSDISATELANGNGYTTGGATATLISSSQTGGIYKLILALAYPTWTATGNMGPFRYLVAYDYSAPIQYLIGCWDAGQTWLLSSGNVYSGTMDGTNGVIQMG